jgi:peptidoglycan/LPS O-acetylase OafA/YrhL
MKSNFGQTKAVAYFANLFFTDSLKASPQSRKTSYRADIDGLRALAVVAVIINHVNSSLLNSGHLGVDIFFVISGFVITLSLFKYHAANPGAGLKRFLVDFYSRRIKRLMPTLVACVIITSLIVIVVSITPQDSLSTARFALVGLANIYLYNIGTNYNSELADANAFLQTWSLGVEEQFYFAYPLIFWILIRLNGLRTARIFIAIFLLSCLSFASYIHLLRTDYWAAFFLMPARFWELGAGVLTCLAVSQRHVTMRWPRLCTTIQPILLVALVACLFAPLAKAGQMTPAVVVTTSALIFAGQKNYSRFNPLLSKPALFLGQISYSLYLWHWSILYTARSLGLNQGWLHTTIIIGISLAVGYGSFRCIENPLRHVSWGCANSTVLGRGIVAPTVLVAAILMGQRLILSIYPPQQQELFNLQNWIGKSKKPCHNSEVTSKNISDKMEQCLDLAPKRPHAVVIGNSHSEQYIPAIKTALPDWDVDYFTMWGCSYEPPSTMGPRFKQKGCDIYGKEVTSTLNKNIKSGDIVFLGYTVSDMLISPELKFHISSLASSLAYHGAKLILLDDLYLADANDNLCDDRLLPYRLGIQKKASVEACLIKKHKSKNFNSLLKYDKLITSIRQRHSNVYHFSIRNQLCPGEECPRKFDDGIPIYQDETHLFSGASQKLGPELKRQLLYNGLSL